MILKSFFSIYHASFLYSADITKFILPRQLYIQVEEAYSKMISIATKVYFV